MSDDIILFDPDRNDDDATRALRTMYAAPADPTYWDGLHARVMAYVLTAEGNGWWSGFGSWTRLGAIAAALALVAVGLGNQEDRDAEARMAYEAVLDDTTPSNTYERVTRTAGLSERDAILAYVISPP